MRPPFDTQELQKALGAFVTGVTVITTREKCGRPRGFTANSFTSVSLVPPLVLVCIAKTAVSSSAFAEAPSYAVSVLNEQQQETANLFASKATGKFDKTRWYPSANGNPIIEGAVAWFDCETQACIEAGDHNILLGRVLHFASTPSSPLAYCRRAYVQFGLFERAMASRARTMRVGAILDYDGSVLLLKGPDGAMLLPVGSSLGPTADKDSLKGILHTHNVDADLEFLFSVFEDSRRHDNTVVHIFYRGTLRRPPSLGGAAMLVPYDDIPYQAVQSEFRGMLRRFVLERTANTAAVYCGDLHSGALQPLSGFPRSWSAGDHQ